MLITIIENAFKHSTLNSTININITVDNGILEFDCSNSFDTTKVDVNAFKIGLQNLEKRLNLIYKDAYEFSISKTDVFMVRLKLNLQ